MELDKLTLRQIKEVQALFGGSQTKANRLFDDIIGEYVIVRSRNEGINCGYVKQADETGVILEKARRLYYHKPLDTNLSWYEGVAMSGCSDDSKISGIVKQKIIIEDYSILICSEKAKEVLENAKTNKQS